MSWNTQVIEDEYVKLTVDAAAWSAELKAVPKGDTVIGIDHFTVKPTETAVSEDYHAEYSTYTESRPFFGFAGGVDNTLLENTNYDIVLAYDLYKNGSVTEYNRLLGVRISTVSRQESGESVIESELPIEDMNGFADYREAAVSFGVNLRQYGGGEIKVTAVITGAEKTVTVTKENMLCFRTTKTDIYGDSYKADIYTVSFRKKDIGYGPFHAAVTVEYLASARTFTTTGSYDGILPFSFYYLKDKGIFKITADEWNELNEDLYKRLKKRGTTLEEPEKVSRGQKFETGIIQAITSLFYALYTSGIALPGPDFRVFSTVSFGTRPENGVSAYELLRKFETWANAVFQA